MRALISGATQGLGEALVMEILRRFPEAKTVGFSRGQENLDVLRQRIDASFPDRSENVHLITGDISSEASVAEVIAKAQKWLGQIDVLINNVGVFRFDEDLSEIPFEDWDLNEATFIEKYSSDPDFDKKQEYYRLVRTNYVGNRALLEAVSSLAEMNGNELSVIDIGSVGVVADLIKKPMQGTAHYGHSKRRLVDHTLSLARVHPWVRVAVVHPGPFGKSAQVIADKFGDTWSVDVDQVAKHTFDLFEELSHDRIVQGVIASEKHFSMSGYLGDLNRSGQVGLTEKRSKKVSQSESTHLTRRI